MEGWKTIVASLKVGLLAGCHPCEWKTSHPWRNADFSKKNTTACCGFGPPPKKRVLGGKNWHPKKKKQGVGKYPETHHGQCFFSHPFCGWTLSFKDMSDSCQTWTHIIDMNGSWIESRSRLGSWKKTTTTNKQHTTSNKQQQRQKPPESSNVLLVCLEKKSVG